MTSSNLLKEFIRKIPDLKKRIDHTNLSPFSTFNQLEKELAIVEKIGLRAFVIPPRFVRELVAISKVPIVTVAGFPLGFETIEVKKVQIEKAAKEGAQEIDYVININAVKENDYDYIRREAEALHELVKGTDVKLKAIIETSLLSTNEILKVSEVLATTGIDFIKTNTGFGPRGARFDDIVLIKSVLEKVNPSVRIKASGGIRTLLEAFLFVYVGADVIGTSSGIKIGEEFDKILKEERME